MLEHVGRMIDIDVGVTASERDVIGGNLTDSNYELRLND